MKQANDKEEKEKLNWSYMYPRETVPNHPKEVSKRRPSDIVQAIQDHKTKGRES